MPGPVVFISHSTRDVGDEGRVATLCQALGDLALTIRVDSQDLVLGEPFRPYIHLWMHECRAAVILLSPEALGSDEVINEAAVLANRKAVAPEFVLIPLLVGATTYDDLEQKAWLKFELSQKDAVQWEDGEPVPPRLLERLGQVAALYPGTSPREQFEDDLATHLDNAGVHHRTLERAAEKLSLDDLHRWPERDRTLVFARRLLESAYERQIEALGEIAYSHLPVAEKILDRAWPYGWIDERAATFIANIAAADRGRRGVAVNSQSVDTSRMYVKRASRDWLHATVEAGLSDLDVEETLDRARAALAYALLGREKAGFDELAQALHDDESPVFLLMQHPPPEPAQLKGVRERFPVPTVVVLCGDDTPEEFARRELTDVAYLDPPVDRELELRVTETYNKALWKWKLRMRAHEQ